MWGWSWSFPEARWPRRPGGRAGTCEVGTGGLVAHAERLPNALLGAAAY